MTCIKNCRRAWLAGLLAMAASLPSQAQEGPQPRLPTVTLTAGMHVIQAEWAESPAQQAAGLMFRKQMGANEGMLFADAHPGIRCFWMRNTLLPLTIAFIDDSGTIVNLADMKPLDETSHCSTAPVRFALEMHQGWFAKRGIQAGSKIRGGPFGR